MLYQATKFNSDLDFIPKILNFWNFIIKKYSFRVLAKSFFSRSLRFYIEIKVDTSTSVMAVPIKLFLKVRNFFEAAGFAVPSSKAHQNGCAFNRKNLFLLFSLGLMLISASTFFFFKANSAYEYGASYSGCNIATAQLLYFIAFMCKTKNILQLIDQYEKFFQKSKNREGTTTN